MSYTGEQYSGNKYVHTIASAGTVLTLDNIMVQINSGTNAWRIKVKTVSGTIAVFGVSNYYQGTSVIPDSAYAINIGNTSYYEFYSTPFVRYMNDTGCTHDLYFRTNASSNNAGIYHICAIAGVGNGASGFDKFSLTLKRL